MYIWGWAGQGAVPLGECRALGWASSCFQGGECFQGSGEGVEPPVCLGEGREGLPVALGFLVF